MRRDRAADGFEGHPGGRARGVRVEAYLGEEAIDRIGFQFQPPRERQGQRLHARCRQHFS